MQIPWKEWLQNLGVLLMFAVACEGIAVQTYLVIHAERHPVPVIEGCPVQRPTRP